jgi:hypothetical protein
VNTSQSVNSYVNNIRFIGLNLSSCTSVDSIVFVFDTRNYEDEIEYILYAKLRPNDFHKPFRYAISDKYYNELNKTDGLSTYCFSTSLDDISYSEKGLCKWDSFSCPSSKIINKTVLNRKEIRLSTLNSIFPYFDSDSLFLMISDIDNNIYVINSNSGNKLAQFDVSTLDAHVYYAKYYASSQTEVETAKSGEKQLKKMGRNQVPLYKIVCHNGKIYAACGLQVLINLKEDFNYYNDRMIQKTITKGSPFFWQFSLLLEFDSTLNLTNSYGINEESLPEKLKGSYLAGVDYGFDLIGDSLLATYSTPNARYDISTEDPSVSFYKLSDSNIYNFSYGSECSFPTLFEHREFYCINAYVSEMDSGLLFNIPAYNYYTIINSETGKTIKQAKIAPSYTDSVNSEYAKYVQDTSYTALDFYVIDIYADSTIFKFMYIQNDSIYLREDSSVINLSNLSGFPSIDIEEFDEGNCTIRKNDILFINKENRGYILYRIEEQTANTK